MLNPIFNPYQCALPPMTAPNTLQPICSITCPSDYMHSAEGHVQYFLSLYPADIQEMSHDFMPYLVNDAFFLTKALADMRSPLYKLGAILRKAFYSLMGWGTPLSQEEEIIKKLQVRLNQIEAERVHYIANECHQSFEDGKALLNFYKTRCGSEPRHLAYAYAKQYEQFEYQQGSKVNISKLIDDKTQSLKLNRIR